MSYTPVFLKVKEWEEKKNEESDKNVLSVLVINVAEAFRYCNMLKLQQVREKERREKKEVRYKLFNVVLLMPLICGTLKSFFNHVPHI